MRLPRRLVLELGLAAVLGATASAVHSGCGASGGRGGRRDASFDDRDGGRDGAAGPCDPDTRPCAKGQRCLQGACIPDNGTCAGDDDCQNDTYCYCATGGGGDMGACMGGVCIPWGTGPRGLFDPECHGQSFSATDFKPPKVACHWSSKAGSNVVMTPIVIDLDNDGTPEIVFAPMIGSGFEQRLVAIRTSDCTELWDQAAGLQGFSQIAAADLDGDKLPEIVGIDATKHVKVFSNKGQLLATSPTPYSFTTGGSFDCSGPVIADVDGKFPPEIIVAGQVLRYTKGKAQLDVLWTTAVPAATWGTLDAVADLDGDGKAEVIVGTRVFDGVTGADKTPPVMKSLAGVQGAYPGIADFNKDKKPDIVVVQSESGQQRVSVIDFANNKVLFGPYAVAGGGWGGPPTIADYDGDGVPDFGLASADHYYAYSLKCAQMNKPKDCTGTDPGVLWERATHDASSGSTGSSLFDFNGDGKAKVVYRDECWLRVYNGPDGKVLFAANVTSGTALELPVIADIDNDGHAEIVVPSDNLQQGSSSCGNAPEADTKTPWVGYTTGLFIYKDPMNRWMPSRGIWNESAYHITNVNDDATIPLSEPANWLSFNNFRQNVQGLVDMKGAPQADLTSGKSISLEGGSSDCKNAWTLWAQLCNRGTAQVKPGVPGTFYLDDPNKPGVMKICTAVSKTTINPGSCEPISCDWKNPPQEPKDLWFRADDDGMGNHPVGECKNKNDLLFLPGAQCLIVG